MPGLSCSSFKCKLGMKVLAYFVFEVLVESGEHCVISLAVRGELINDCLNGLIDTRQNVRNHA